MVMNEICLHKKIQNINPERFLLTAYAKKMNTLLWVLFSRIENSFYITIHGDARKASERIVGIFG